MTNANKIKEEYTKKMLEINEVKQIFMKSLESLKEKCQSDYSLALKELEEIKETQNQLYSILFLIF